jgi:general secretion pathway protein M
MTDATTTMQALTRRWQILGARERRVLGWAGVLLAGALLWSLGLAPALRVLQAAPSQHDRLDAQLQAMQSLALQARALQNQPRLSRDDSLRALENSVRQLLGNTGQLRVSAERAELTLKGSAPAALAQWLVQARQNARVLPGEIRLDRSALGWDGTLVLLLPAP